MEIKTFEKIAGLEKVCKGTPFEEKAIIRQDLANIIKNIKNLKEGEKELNEFFKNLKKDVKGKEKNFGWCEIKGKAEAYCMANTCGTCPANKYGIYYNPDSKLIRMYKEGKIESRFDSINESINEIKFTLKKWNRL